MASDTMKWGLVGKLFMGPKEPEPKKPDAADVGKAAGKGLHGTREALKKAAEKRKRK